MLDQEITRGQSLFPRLSRQIYNSATQDGLLLDWGVFHFHLGTGPDSRYPQLIQGHSEILYAAVDDDTVYFLTIDHHGKWADEDILRIIKNDFPYLLDPFRLDGVLGLSQSVSESERTTLRRVGASTLVELDGHVYAPPGGGINSAGGGMASTMQLQQTARWYSAAEDVIRQDLSTLADEDPKANWIQDADFEFRLKNGEDHEIAVRDDNLAVSIVLNISTDNQRFDSITVKTDGAPSTTTQSVSTLAALNGPVLYKVFPTGSIEQKNAVDRPAQAGRRAVGSGEWTSWGTWGSQCARRRCRSSLSQGESTKPMRRGP